MHLRFGVGAFLMPETERRGAREKRIPGVPEGLQMRLGGMLRRHMFLYALCVPLHGDFGRREGSSPVESESAAEGRVDGLGSGCADSRLALPEDDESGTKESTADGGCYAT